MVDTLLNVFEKIIYSEKVEVVTRGWWICTGLLWQTDGRNDPCIKHPEKTNNLHNCSYKVSCVRNFAAIIIQLSLWHAITNWADIEKILNGIQNQEIYYQISNFRWKGRTDGKWCILWLILCCLLVKNVFHSGNKEGFAPLCNGRCCFLCFWNFSKFPFVYLVSKIL